MIETLLATLLFSTVAIGLIQCFTTMQLGLRQQTAFYQDKINTIEQNLNDLFIPVEDIEWAINQVLP